MITIFSGEFYPVEFTFIYIFLLFLIWFPYQYLPICHFLLGKRVVVCFLVLLIVEVSENKWYIKISWISFFSCKLSFNLCISLSESFRTDFFVDIFKVYFRPASWPNAAHLCLRQPPLLFKFCDLKMYYHGIIIMKMVAD